MKQPGLRVEFAIAAAYCFVQNFSSGILTNSLWPYLKLLDPSITESFFGYIVGAASVSGLLSNIICGFIASKNRDVRFPISIGISLMILGNLVYFNLHHFHLSFRYAAMISRLLAGMSAGNSCLISTFVALSAGRDQLPRVIALTSCGSTLGMLLGPALQNVFTYIGYPGISLFGMNINEFNAPALAAIVINFFGLFVITFLKNSNKNSEENINEDHETLLSSGNSPENHDIFHVFGYKGIPLCMATRFVQFFVLNMMETIGSSYTMFAFGWNSSEALLYGSRSSLFIGIIALIFHSIYTTFPCIRWKNHTYGCVFALFSFSSYFVISFPWKFLHDGRRVPSSVDLCVNSSYSWCEDVIPPSVVRFYFPYYLCVTVACCALSLSNSTCLTQFAGRKYQGIAQSLQQISSYSASIIASVAIGSTFSSSGPSSVWIVEISLTIAMALIWIFLIVSTKISFGRKTKYEPLRTEDDCI